MIASLCRSGILFALFVAAHSAAAQDFKQAQTAFKDKDYPRVVEILDKYIEDRPKAGHAYALRGRALLEMREFKRAVEDLDRALAANEDASGAHFLRGRAYLGLNPAEVDKALADFNKAIEGNPKLADRYFYRGLAHFAKNDLDAAFTDFHSALGLDPKHYLCYVYRGMTQVARGTRYTTFTFERAGQVYSARKAEVVDRDKVVDGIADFARAIELDANRVDGYYHRINAHHLLGDIEAAIADQKVFCKLEEKNAEAWNQLAWELATNPKDAIRNGKEAIEAAEKACELTESKDPRFVDTLAAAYAEAKKFKKAVDTQKKAIELVANAAQPEFQKELEKRLDLYQKKQPYREGPAPVAAPPGDAAKP